MNKLSLSITTLAAAALLALASCGGGGDDAGTNPGNDTTPPRGTSTEPGDGRPVDRAGQEKNAWESSKDAWRS